MAEVKEQDKQEEPAPEHKTEAQERISIENQIMDEFAKTEKAKEPSGEETKAEEEPKKEPDETQEKTGQVKLSASERVQQAVNQKKEAEERAEKAEKATESLQNEISDLKTELQKISTQLASGQMTQKQAEQAAETVSDDFEKAIAGIELPDELTSYAKNIAEIANAMIKPLKAKLEALESERAEEKKANADRERVQTEQKAISQYNEIGKDYSELFVANEEGELSTDEKGFYILKSDFEKKAQQFVEPFYGPDGNNRMLMTKEGLKLLFDHLYQGVSKAKQVKKDIETTQKKVDETKKSRVESPESRNMPAKKKTLEEEFEEQYRTNYARG